MYAGNPDVPDDVFADVLKQIKDFVRTRVVPREVEIMTTDAIPHDVRALAAERGLFGYAIPQGGKASASTSSRTSRSPWSSATRHWPSGRC